MSKNLLSRSSYGAYGVIRLPDAPAKEDTDFIGRSDGASLYAANELYNVEDNTVFTAQWKKFSAVTDLGNGNYTVDYRLLNGGAVHCVYRRVGNLPPRGGRRIFDEPLRACRICGERRSRHPHGGRKTFSHRKYSRESTIKQNETARANRSGSLHFVF